MIGVALALLAAMSYGLSVILVRRNLDDSNVLKSVWAVTFVGNVVLWPLSLLFSDLRTVKPEGLILFAIAGLLAPGILRLIYYKGMQVLGPSTNALVFATYPMYSVITAAFLLNETLSATNWSGMICILIGVVIVERGWRKGQINGSNSLRNFAFPIMATLTVAISHIVRKYGLSTYNEPMLGVAIGYASSLLVCTIVLIRCETYRQYFSLKRELRLFWKAGVGLSVGWLLTFFALSHENVSVVTPLLQAETLFVMLFSHLLLNRLDHISVEMSVSVIVILVGVALVSIR